MPFGKRYFIRNFQAGLSQPLWSQMLHQNAIQEIMVDLLSILWQTANKMHSERQESEV